MMNRPPHKQISAPDKIRGHITSLVTDYFVIKNALVDSDFSNARAAAAKLGHSLHSVDMTSHDHESLPQWKEIESQLQTTLATFELASDIDSQRRYFARLSDILVEMAETFGLPVETVFVAYCPMAFGDKGAYWLSEFEEIKNPYYVAAMLTCGEVKRTITQPPA